MAGAVGAPPWGQRTTPATAGAFPRTACSMGILAIAQCREWLDPRLAPSSFPCGILRTKPALALQEIDARLRIIFLSWNVIDALPCVVADVPLNAATYSGGSKFKGKQAS